MANIASKVNIQRKMESIPPMLGVELTSSDYPPASWFSQCRLRSAVITRRCIHTVMPHTQGAVISTVTICSDKSGARLRNSRLAMGTPAAPTTYQHSGSQTGSPGGVAPRQRCRDRTKDWQPMKK
ncbi:MAG: hypothetical protein PVJ19_20820, partial [Desulfobacteraceae bacterium]